MRLSLTMQSLGFLNVHRGYALLELLAVIAVIALISVWVMPQIVNTAGINVNYEAWRVLHDIRYTQMLSMSSGQRYRWLKVSDNAYQIQNEAGTPLVLPSGNTSTVFAGGISFGSLTNSILAFDSQGIPYSDAGYPGTVLASTASITLTGGGLTRTIQISPQTGYGMLQ